MAARGKEHGELIALLNAKTVNSDIGQRGVFRIACQHQLQTEERTGIYRRVGRCRKQFTQIEVRIVGIKHLLLTRRLGRRDDNGSNRVFHRLADMFCQFRGLAAQQERRPLAAGVHTDQNTGVGIPLNSVKHHGRADARRTFYRAASTNVPVHTRQLRVRIDRMAGFKVLTFMAF